MKASTWIIIVLAVLMALTVAAMIITVQACVIAQADLKNRAMAAEKQENDLRLAIHQRDGFLGTIKTDIPFKNMADMKQVIEKWENLKLIEKEAQK